MRLTDVIVSKILSDEQIKEWIASETGLSCDKILIVSDLLEAPVNTAIEVLCHKVLRGGDFPMQLSFYADDSVFSASKVESLLQKFCATCGCNILVSDHQVNPYTWILITETEDHRSVSVDVDRLDECDEFVIDRINTPKKQR